MAINGGFHFLTANIFAAADNDLFLAIYNVKITCLIEIPDVTRLEITVFGKGVVSRLVIIPITGEIGGRANTNLSEHPFRVLVSVIGKKVGLNTRRQPT